MRIGMDIRVAHPLDSGQQRYLWRLGAWLGGRGHEVHYLTVRPQHERLDAPAGTTLHRFDALPRGALRAAVDDLGLDALLLNPERSRRYRGIGANVLRAGYGTDQYSQKMRSFRTEPAATVRGALRRTPWALAERRWERHFYESAPAPHVVAQSSYMRDQILGRYRVPPAHVHVVRNGVDTDEFTPEARLALRDTARTRWGITGSTLCLLAVAHNFRLKGVWQAMEALARVDDSIRVHLLVAGSGTGHAQRRQARRLARRFGVEGRVTFCGAVSPSMSALAAADAVVHLSWHDSFGFAVLEAMACGLPVITTSWVGASELIEAGRSGLLVDPTRPDEIAAALRALGDPDAHGAMGAAAHASAITCDEATSFEGVLRVMAAAAGRA